MRWFDPSRTYQSEPPGRRWLLGAGGLQNADMSTVPPFEPKAAVHYPVGLRHERAGAFPGIYLHSDAALQHVHRVLRASSKQERRFEYLGPSDMGDLAPGKQHLFVCDSPGTAAWARDVIRSVAHPDDRHQVVARAMEDGKLIESTTKGSRIAARMVAGKPVFRESVGTTDGTMVGTGQPPLNLGDNELRANNVGDQDSWQQRNPATPAGKAAAIKRKMDMNKESLRPKGADTVPAPLGDNMPPPTAGIDNSPALQLPDGMR